MEMVKEIIRSIKNIIIQLRNTCNHQFIFNKLEEKCVLLFYSTDDVNMGIDLLCVCSKCVLFDHILPI
jgi:hypothetical protein